MITNCTPHEIVVRTTENVYVFKPCGILPRLTTEEIPADDINGLPSVRQEVSEVEGLPEFNGSTFYIVSGMVFNASNRIDLIAPDTGKTAFRNEKGQIEAVSRFLRK